MPSLWFSFEQRRQRQVITPICSCFRVASDIHRYSSNSYPFLGKMRVSKPWPYLQGVFGKEKGGVSVVVRQHWQISYV
jgi:hypothetical protein